MLRYFIWLGHRGEASLRADLTSKSECQEAVPQLLTEGRERTEIPKLRLIVVYLGDERRLVYMAGTPWKVHKVMVRDVGRAQVGWAGLLKFNRHTNHLAFVERLILIIQ